ncbi:uncharacterized protein LOC136715783 [Amia ocellicauda]|uniref:uncharacterized protein LOC136715783 n=1 Tax=Amia ocellicauda TaxID=2972642 RepID=UPI003463D2A9
MSFAIEIPPFGLILIHLSFSNGNMSGNVSATASVLTPNRNANLETTNRDLDDAIYEFKVFNITVTSLALCILIFTGIFCSVSYHNRRRQHRQARAYEDTVARENLKSPVDIKAVKRTHSLRNPLSWLRRQDTYKENSQIYFIYSNPLATAEDSVVTTEGEPIVFENMLMQSDSLKDTAGGIILDPSTFYMQL